MPEEAPDSREILLRNAREGRLPHGLLLTGREYPQIEETALEVAAALLGVAAPAPGQALAHPDLHSLRPAGRMRQISADATREIIRQIFQTSHASGAKVAIVHEADCFHQTAANVFLKTLEEPPPGTYILLLTTRPYALLPTIRSRCLFFRLPLRSKSLLLNDHALSWLEDFRGFLDTASQPVKTAGGAAPGIMKAYGLIVRFGHLQNEQVAEARKRNPEISDLPDDEQKAMEKRLEIEARQSLLQALEEECMRFSTDLAEKEGAFPTAALHETIQALEEASGLLHANLNAQTALEMVFLRTLRCWARRIR